MLKDLPKYRKQTITTQLTIVALTTHVDCMRIQRINSNYMPSLEKITGDSQMPVDRPNN